MSKISSYEIVTSAVEFQKPSRIPIEDLSYPNSSDIVGVGFEPSIWKWHQVSPGTQECTDLFGCVRRRHDNGIGQVCDAPLKSWDKLDSFILPDIKELKDKTAEQLNALPENKFVIGDIGQFLQKISEIRGFENFLLDLAMHTSEIRTLSEHLTDFAVARTKMYAELGQIHCISIFDDWGTQASMILSPDQWRTLFFDFYKKLFECAHDCNMYTYFHCCGDVGPIIPDMIEAGADIINFDQPCLHGIEHLATEYSGKVTFCCPVDIQATLPTGDKDLIKAEAHQLVKQLHNDGGFIAKIYHPWADTEAGFDSGEYCKQIFQSIKL